MTAGSPIRDRLAIGLARLAYGLFYLAVVSLVVGVPIGLVFLLFRGVLP
jgi:hypothetical protein